MTCGWNKGLNSVRKTQLDNLCFKKQQPYYWGQCSATCNLISPPLHGILLLPLSPIWIFIQQPLPTCSAAPNGCLLLTKPTPLC